MWLLMRSGGVADSAGAWYGNCCINSSIAFSPHQPPPLSSSQVDVEGFDVAAYDGMQGVLQAGAPIAVTTMEYNQPMAWAAGKCWGEEALAMMSELGYAFSDHHDFPLSTRDLLTAAVGASERIPKKERTTAPPAHELWMTYVGSNGL